MPHLQLGGELTAFCYRKNINLNQLATLLEHCETLTDGVVIYRKTLAAFGADLGRCEQRAYQIMQTFEAAGLVERYGHQGRLVIYRVLVTPGGPAPKEKSEPVLAI